MFALVDCNNFFVSCEQVFAPHLVGKPVVVLSNNEGCVIARSKEAKQIGIPMGAPFFKINYLVRQYNVQMFSSNFALYGDFSRRVMTILKTFSSQVEVYSVDEAFLYFKKPETCWHTFAEIIKHNIKTNLGIDVSVGVASTKTLAKLAVGQAKLGSGVTVLIDKHDIAIALKETSIGDVWGIGKKIAENLRKHAIYTAYDFVEKDQRWVRKAFNVVGARTQLELRGINCLPLEHYLKDRQSIQITRGFVKPHLLQDELESSITQFINDLAQKLRHLHLKTNLITVFLKDTKLKGGMTQSLSFTLDQPSYLTDDLLRSAIWCVRQMYISGIAYKRAGVIASNLTSDVQQQQNISTIAIPYRNNEKTELFHKIDALNKRFGKKIVRLGYYKELTDKYSSFPCLKSRAYTTSWNDLMVVS